MGMVDVQFLDRISKGIAIDSLRKIRKGILILIIASIIGSLLTGMALASLFLLPLGIGTDGDIFIIPTVDVTMMVLSLVNCVLLLIALFVFIIPGISRLADWNAVFSTPSKLIKMGYGMGTMLMLIALAIIISGVSTPNLGILLSGVVLGLIAAIMMFMGYIGFVILSFKLKDVFGETIFLIASILFIVGIFIFILIPIAWILMFIGLGIAISKLEALPPSYQLHHYGYRLPK